MQDLVIASQVLVASSIFFVWVVRYDNIVSEFRQYGLPDWLRDLVGRLTNHHEAARPAPWSVDDAPADYVQQMLRAIVGIRIPVTRLVGKWKVSQNRSVADRLGVAAGLMASADAGAPRAMADLVKNSAKPAAGDPR